MKILECRQSSRNKAYFKINVTEVVKKLPLLTSGEKKMLARKISIMKYMGEEDCMKELIKMFGKLERRGSSRQKKEIAKTLLDGDEVFYVCSKHSNCADDHKDWEGKVYYDRYWRMKNSDMPDWLKTRIEKEIARKDMKSVQWVTKGPVWLTTRPYCKHFFTPVGTYKVLAMQPDSYMVKTVERRTKRGSTEEYIRKKRGL